MQNKKLKLMMKKNTSSFFPTEYFSHVASKTEKYSIINWVEKKRGVNSFMGKCENLAHRKYKRYKKLDSNA